METFWWVVVVAAGSLLTIIGWFRFIDHDARVPRKPKYVILPEDESRRESEPSSET